ncbi:MULTISPECIES: hypothetical protein [Pseudomonas]|uniref:hypothetical protein n=1 Tax=Pseudomonas TaxID=286 RepID=UPI0016443D64|nr:MULTISPECIES: hypothetical protein [Pseudomonas]QXI23792.1 hypothetical protein HU724_005815 [Pseudomonas iranensis]
MTQSITFPGADFGMITCKSNPQKGIEVKVALPGAQVGSPWELVWEGFRDAELTQPVEGTQTPPLKDFVTETDTTEGLKRTIGDYFLHIRPIRIGWGKVTFTLNRGNPQHESVHVKLINNAGEDCEGVPGK